MDTTQSHVADLHPLQRIELTCGARNYHPLPVVFTRGSGAWLFTDDGRRILDLMSAYSAVSFGHCHPVLTHALIEQASQLTLTSRAASNARLPVFLQRLTRLTQMDCALPMNTGAEAVETALKAARKWGYQVKGIRPGHAKIVACHGNFHGRTTAIIGLSSEAQYRNGFGPFPPGLQTIPFGNADALEAAITPETCAFLVEPVQGEGGIVVPPAGYLAQCKRICERHQVLLIADEVQTGLGRTGALLACDHDNIRPDGLVLGKTLGGGVLPVSAFLARRDVMDVFQPGDHGSTFGGNPLAAAVGLAVMDLLDDPHLLTNIQSLGATLRMQLESLQHPGIADIRGKGLLLGVELRPEYGNARQVVERMLAAGLFSKDTHGSVIRLAPPFVVTASELTWAVARMKEVLDNLRPMLNQRLLTCTS